MSLVVTQPPQLLPVKTALPSMTFGVAHSTWEASGEELVALTAPRRCALSPHVPSGLEPPPGSAPRAEALPGRVQPCPPGPPRNNQIHGIGVQRVWTVQFSVSSPPAMGAGAQGLPETSVWHLPQGLRVASPAPPGPGALPVHTAVLGYHLPLHRSPTWACPGHINLSREQSLESQDVPHRPKARFECESEKGLRAYLCPLPSWGPCQERPLEHGARASAPLYSDHAPGTQTPVPQELVNKDSWAPGRPTPAFSHPRGTRAGEPLHTGKGVQHGRSDLRTGFCRRRVLSP